MGTNRGFLVEHLFCKNVQPYLRVSFASTSQPFLYLVPYRLCVWTMRVPTKEKNRKEKPWLAYFCQIPDPGCYPMAARSQPEQTSVQTLDWGEVETTRQSALN